VRVISFILSIPFLGCYTTTKETFYSYSVTSYTVDTTKTLLYTSNLISCGDYLIEFKTKTNIRTDIYEDSLETKSMDYDTLGVYLLSGGNKLFYEFDTFALKGRIIKVDKLENKPSGQSLNFHGNTDTPNLSFTPPKKITVNNVPCFITELIESKTEDEGINQKVLLVKDQDLNSLYKIMGIKYPDSNYCVVGFIISDSSNKTSFVQEIQSLRLLNEREKRICEKMIATSKTYVVDTLKN
jgi:hypothetical protein